MIYLDDDTRAEADALRKAIWELLQGHHPSAAADALITLLAHVIARNARDPAAMAAALSKNLRLVVDDDDAESLPN
jgi:hypothetical protein